MTSAECPTHVTECPDEDDPTEPDDDEADAGEPDDPAEDAVSPEELTGLEEEAPSDAEDCSSTDTPAPESPPQPVRARGTQSDSAAMQREKTLRILPPEDSQPLFFANV